jgi:hypothetical protein
MKKLNIAERVIIKPDLKNETENELRARALGEYRGYGQHREMFQDVPDNLHWYEAELKRKEIGNLRYVDYSYWNELTDHTHCVRDAVANIQKGKSVFDVSHDRFWSVSQLIRQAKHDFEPMILWGDDKDSTLEIIEGHLRATTFGLAEDEAPETIKVIVGLRQSTSI